MFSLDTKSRIPVHEQIEQMIVKYINLGVLSPDEQLPSVRNMAQELGVNPNTVQKAYKILESQNVIYMILGKGVFVSSSANSLNSVKELTKNKFENAVNQAIDIGLSKDELIEIINKAYKEGQND